MCFCSTKKDDHKFGNEKSSFSFVITPAYHEATKKAKTNNSQVEDYKKMNSKWNIKRYVITIFSPIDEKCT